MNKTMKMIYALCKSIEANYADEAKGKSATLNLDILDIERESNIYIDLKMTHDMNDCSKMTRFVFMQEADNSKIELLREIVYKDEDGKKVRDDSVKLRVDKIDTIFFSDLYFQVNGVMVM